MNPRLDHLQPYPFEKLRQLLATAKPEQTGLPLVDLSIGEPKHAAPEVAKQAIVESLDALSGYPPTKGPPMLRRAIANWIGRRYAISAPDPETEVLPILGSREALFAFAQTVINPDSKGLVVCPNPFYQIYEGAALLAGAQPHYVNAIAEHDFLCDWASVKPDVWRKTQLLYVCNPGNPSGGVMPLSDWELLFELADRHDFVIASDECYSESISTNKTRRLAVCRPPLPWDAATLDDWSVFQAYRSARTCLAYVRGLSRATPSSSNDSCSTGPITAVPCLVWSPPPV
jgi:N-succinyldiaminopimelate aminotransferase